MAKTANNLTSVPTFLIAPPVSLLIEQKMQTNVIELMLSRNKLSSIDLALVLRSLPNLQVLDLSQNEIESLVPASETTTVCTSNVKK